MSQGVLVKGDDGRYRELRGDEHGNIRVNLSGSTAEYAWFEGGEEPVPSDLTKVNLGIVIDPTSDDITIKYYHSGAWKELSF